MKLSVALLNLAFASALAAPASEQPRSGTKARLAARTAARLSGKAHSFKSAASSSSSSGSSSGSSSFGPGFYPGSGSPSGDFPSQSSAAASYPSGFPSGSNGSKGSASQPSAAVSVPSGLPSGSSGSDDTPAQASAAASASSTSSSTHTTSSSKSSDVEYNESWAGAVVTGSGMTGVSASFKVPTPAIPTDGQTSATEHTASTWIGMDGYNCDGGLWQAGVDASIDSSGSTSYYAWYEWYPSDTVEIDLGTLTAGDTITVNLTSSGAYTSGNIVMENTSTGKSFTKTVTDSDALCGSAIEWIMEDLVVDGSEIGLANFGTITFTDAKGTSSSGSVSPSSAQILDIEDSDGTALTSSSATSNSVVIAYK